MLIQLFFYGADIFFEQFKTQNQSLSSASVNYHSKKAVDRNHAI